MEKKQLVSVRLDKENVEWINQLSQNYNYLNRSFVINHLLSALRICAVRDDVERLLASFDPFADGCAVGISFKK